MNKSVGILGGGFGLYGYLPALKELGFEVHTLCKYRDSAILGRPNLAEMRSSLEFHETDTALISSVQYLVISRRPEDQFSLIDECLEKKTVHHLFLEKPLAPSLPLHKKTLQNLESLGISFSVGYLFLQTPWCRAIQQLIADENELQIEIVWQMIRPSGWKLSADSGGGIFDYYLIHFIPLFVRQFEYLSTSLKEYTDNSVVIDIRFFSCNGKGLVLRINFSFSEYPFFSVYHKSCMDAKCDYEGLSPFTQSDLSQVKSSADERIPLLKNYISSVFHSLRNQEEVSLVRRSVATEEGVIEFRRQIRNLI